MSCIPYTCVEYDCSECAESSLFDDTIVQLEYDDEVHPLQKAGIDEGTELDIIFASQGRNIFVTEV